MPYCPACGTELEEASAYCRNCGEAVGGSAPEPVAGTGSDPDDRGQDGWDWLDPRGPFRSPRNVLNTLNTVGLVILFVGLGLAFAGVEAPFGFLPDPLLVVLLIYLLGVIFLGIPVWFVLLVTDNVLGFLRKG